MTERRAGAGVEAYKATLRFIQKLAGLAAMVLVAWWVIPHLGGFCRWVGGLDPKVLIALIGFPVGAVTLLGIAAIYAVFFKGTGFIERIVNSETAKEAVRAKVTIRDGDKDEGTAA